MNASITMGDAMQVVGVLLALAGFFAGLVRYIGGRFDEQRRDSEEGRRRLYTRVEQSEQRTAEQVHMLRAHMDEHFVRRTTYDVELRGVRDSLTEVNAIIGTVSGRVCPYPPDRP